MDYEAACSFLLDKFASLNQNVEKSIYAVSSRRRSVKRRRAEYSLFRLLCAAFYLCN